MKFAAIAIIACLSISAEAAEITAGSETWQVLPDFKMVKNKHGKYKEPGLSGAACVTGTTHCLIADDEATFAQFFDIEPGMLKTGPVIALLPEKQTDGKLTDEIDAEAVAYANGMYYVTGSHGLSRKKGEFRENSFLVFRFKVDPASGQPSFAFDDLTPAPGIQSSAWLRQLILETPQFMGHGEQPLDKNGATMEGMMADGADLLFGFRAPSVGEGEAIVLRVGADALFGTEKPVATAMTVKLAAGLGIRDMTATESGVLLLAGPSASEGGLASLWLWDKTATAPARLGDLPDVATSDRAETLLLLAEDKRSFRILILFDKAHNGSPREYTLMK